MQHVSRLAPAAPPLPQAQAPRAGTTCQVRVRATMRPSRGAGRAAPAPRLRARGGGAEAGPVDARREDGEEAEAEAGLAAEELEVLEEAAIAGEDEGRRPTDYDRRAHIFEDSSRVFRALKQRRDGDGRGGVGDVGAGSSTSSATAETATQQQQQQLG